MVATLVRLKLRLLANTFKRELWRWVLLIFGALYGAALLVGLVVGAQALAQGDVLTRQLVAAGLGSLLVLGWAVVPLVAFGVDDTLDPQRFALFTVPSPRLALALVVAGAIGIPGVLTVLLAQAPVLLWTSGPRAVAATLTAVAGGLLAALTCLLVARVATTAVAGRLRSRRGRDAVALGGVLLLLPLALLPAITGSLDLSTIATWLPRVVSVLAWTPLGAPWAAPGDIAAGATATGLARLAVSAATVAALAVAWARLLPAAMESVGTGTARKERRTTAVPLVLAPALARALRLPLPAAAVAARALRYWRGDPRYLSNAVGIVIGSLVVTFAITAIRFGPGSAEGAGSGLWWGPLVAAPMFAAFAGWTVHNDTAMDSTAFWMHLSTGLAGRHDRLGRTVAAAVWMVPAVILLTLAGCAWTQRWDLLPAALGAGLGCLGAGLAVSAVGSAVLVYPVQPPGSSPFSSSSTGNVMLTLVVQAVTSAAATVLSLPAIVTGVLALAVAPWWGWVCLALGLGGGVGLAAAGVVVGGRRLDAGGPRLLTTMRGWPKH